MTTKAIFSATCSANVPVQQLPGCLQEPVRQVQEKFFCKTRPPPVAGILLDSNGRVTQIIQRRSRCPPTVLELHESRVVRIGTSQVKFLKPIVLGLLNRLPEEEVHGTEIVIVGMRYA